jgi:hypothetical protein
MLDTWPRAFSKCDFFLVFLRVFRLLRSKFLKSCLEPLSRVLR